MRNVLIATAASLVLLGAWAAADWWPGVPNDCVASGDCYCEKSAPGPMRQPANTLSAFGFVAVGLAAAARARSRRANALAVIIALLGPGAMALHASLTKWGGVVDVMSMHVFIAFLLALDAERLWKLPLVPLYAVSVALLTFVEVALPRSAILVFGSLVAAWGTLNVLRGPATRNGRWLAGAGAFFALALAVWIPSRSPAGALCDPDSLLQGHAAWHLLSALAAGCLYRYVEPELGLD